MTVDTDTLKSEFRLKMFGAKGWLCNTSIACPYCSRSGKFGFRFNQDKEGGVCHCFFCDTKKPITTYLFDIGRSDLVQKGKQSVSLFSKLREPIFESNKVSKELPEVTLPYGIKPIKNDPYLKERGFTKEHYQIFQPCYTDSFLEPKLHGYMIFKIFQEGRLVSWLARTKMSYQWHKENLEGFKRGECDLIPRYSNSAGTDFDSILGGIDEVTNETDTVIIVEGMFDKINTDRLLGLNRSPQTKCLFSFGNKLSDGQFSLLKNRKSVKNLVFLYDFGTRKQTLEYGLKCSEHWNTLVCEIEHEDIDPGNISFDYLIHVLNNAVNPIKYNLKLTKKFV